MSQQNVEIVGRVLVALAEGDRERMIAFADPEIVVDASRNVFNPRTYEGIEGLRRRCTARQGEGLSKPWGCGSSAPRLSGTSRRRR